jgi:hypothetical protein
MNKIFYFVLVSSKCLLSEMLINPIVVEAYQNETGHISGLAGVLHNINGQPAMYFYISLSVSRNAPSNHHNANSCIDITVEQQTYNVICELDADVLDCNVANDKVITDSLYHIDEHERHIFNYTQFKLPLPVWIVINGMLLSQK